MNEIYAITRTFLTKHTDEDIAQELSSKLPDKICSYIVKKYTNEDNKLFCKFRICDKKKFNTLNKSKVINDIQLFRANTETILFGQPSLDIMIEMYTPYVAKLAANQHERWQQLDYEDLIQMCYLSMIKLYRKGYYLNDSLLKTTFIRDVLLHIRKQRTDYKIISLNSFLNDDDSISVADTLEDTEYSNKLENKELFEENMYIFNKVKQHIIEQFGERRFEQLLREYGNKTTSNATRQMLVHIKRNFDKLHITIDTYRE